jgi:hypothetical protein
VTSHITVPIILKGVQTWEDALLAYDAGLAGVVLSNHGGRQLDFARSGLEVLVEVVRELGARRGLKFPNDKFAVLVDGGVRRATDVLKAVALGASAVRASSSGLLPLLTLFRLVSAGHLYTHSLRTAKPAWKRPWRSSRSDTCLITWTLAEANPEV